MAQMADSGASDVSSDLQCCTVCLEHYESDGPLTPRILAACLHTFCQGCLERIVEAGGCQVSCPVCRQLNILFGAPGIQNLPVNTKAPCFRARRAEAEEFNVLSFVDPDVPSCPMCGGITLFAPFGEKAEIAQCHTCQWMSVEILEITECKGLTINTTNHEANDQGAQNQDSAPPTDRKKSLIRRITSRLRKRLSFH